MAVGDFKQFPSGGAGVLLPADNRRAAALGICLYTASRPTALRVQQIAYRLTRLLGPRVLPGRAKPWLPALEEWEDLLSTWRHELGLFDNLAVYRRRQQARTGLTILLTHEGKPMAVAKIRDEPGCLQIEQQALDAVRRAGPTTFQVPTALGAGTLDGGLAWSAQTAVFDAPHRPVFTASDQLFGEVHEALSGLVRPRRGQSAAHNDLTPWNLRIDRSGRTWLFDWEDVGPAPFGSDRCYFSVTSHALHRTGMPTNLAGPSIIHWTETVTARRADSRADLDLREAILNSLHIAQRTLPEKELSTGVTA